MTDKDINGCGCGSECGYDHDHDHDHNHEGIELETIVLTFEDEEGNEEEVECGVLGIFDVEENSYIALVVPEDEDGEEAFYIYRYEEEEDGTPVLDVIEEEEEFEKVNDVFEELFFVEDFEEEEV